MYTFYKKNLPNKEYNVFILDLNEETSDYEDDATDTNSHGASKGGLYRQDHHHDNLYEPAPSYPSEPQYYPQSYQSQPAYSPSHSYAPAHSPPSYKPVHQYSHRPPAYKPHKKKKTKKVFVPVYVPDKEKKKSKVNFNFWIKWL